MDKNITISDVAEALGISKTTVSRAISGKGRIGEATRERVMNYITEHDYTPNVIAKGLAQSKTFNLCVVMPGNYALVDLPFFQEAVIGIQEEAEAMQYDILLCICQKDSTESLERILANRKVDGVLLLRTSVKDPQVELLLRKNIPFVTLGSSSYEHVPQIDHDHENACRDLTERLLRKGFSHIALLAGSDSFVVNQNRYRGFEKAFKELNETFDPGQVYWNLESGAQIDQAAHSAFLCHADCILCMDDAICIQVLKLLREEHIRVPEDVRVASFYNSTMLENNIPSVTSLSFDARALGAAACSNLIAQIDGVEYEERLLLSYHVVAGESTR